MTPTQQATANVNARNRNDLIAECVRRIHGNNARFYSDIKVTPEGELVKEIRINEKAG